MSELEDLEELVSNDIPGKWVKPWRPYSGVIARPDECRNGHPYTESNTQIIKKKGRRVRRCLICHHKTSGFKGIYNKRKS